MERRTFLRAACGATLSTFCIAAVPGLLGSCSGASYKAGVEDEKFTIPLSQFIGNDPLIVDLDGYLFPVAVHRNNDGTFTAIVLRCTHASNTLDATGNGFICTAHGSRFDANGNVTKGPASKPLQHLQTELVGEFLTVQLI